MVIRWHIGLYSFKNRVNQINILCIYILIFIYSYSYLNTIDLRLIDYIKTNYFTITVMFFAYKAICNYLNKNNLNYMHNAFYIII